MARVVSSGSYHADDDTATLRQTTGATRPLALSCFLLTLFPTEGAASFHVLCQRVGGTDLNSIPLKCRTYRSVVPTPSTSSGQALPKNARTTLSAEWSRQKPA